MAIRVPEVYIDRRHIGYVREIARGDGYIDIDFAIVPDIERFRHDIRLVAGEYEVFFGCDRCERTGSIYRFWCQHFPERCQHR